MTSSDAQECVTKVCTKCGETKAMDEFSRNSVKCKRCKADYERDRRQANPERYAEINRNNRDKNGHKYAEKARNRAKAHYEKNKEAFKKRAKDWLKNNPEWRREYSKTKTKLDTENGKRRTDIWRERHRKWCNENTKNLGDSYVKARIKSGTHGFQDVPPELIEIKRAQLQIHRATNQLKKSIQERIEKCNNN